MTTETKDHILNIQSIIVKYSLHRYSVIESNSGRIQINTSEEIFTSALIREVEKYIKNTSLEYYISNNKLIFYYT